MKRMLSEEEKGAYLTDHIPYRIKQLEHCIFACEYLRRGEGALNVKNGCWPLLDKCEFRGDSIRPYTNLAVDAGLLAGRALLGFLGLGEEKGALVKGNIRETDVTVARFDRSLLNPNNISNSENASKLLPRLAEIASINDCILLFYLHANKSVAHLTDNDLKQLTAEKLCLGVLIIMSLVGQSLKGEKYWKGVELSPETWAIFEETDTGEIVPRVKADWKLK